MSKLDEQVEEVRAIRSVGRFSDESMFESPGRIHVERVSPDEISIQFTALDEEGDWVVKEAYELTDRGAWNLSCLLGSKA